MRVCSVDIHIDTSNIQTVQKRFMFEHKWYLEEDFEAVVVKKWNSMPEKDQLHTKLERLATHLTDWAKEKLGCLPREIKETKLELNKLLNMEGNPYMAEKISSLQTKLEKLLSQEESH